jgi:hypothetical protein
MQFERGKPPETPNAPYRAARIKDERWRSARAGFEPGRAGLRLSLTSSQDSIFAVLLSHAVLVLFSPLRGVLHQYDRSSHAASNNRARYHGKRPTLGYYPAETKTKQGSEAFSANRKQPTCKPSKSPGRRDKMSDAESSRWAAGRPSYSSSLCRLSGDLRGINQVINLIFRTVTTRRDCSKE